METYNIAQASAKLSNDLQLTVNESRIRAYETYGLIKPERNEDNNYREFTIETLDDLKIIICLAEAGTSIDTIQKYCERTLTPQEVADILKRFISVENCIHQAREALSKYSFTQSS